MRSKLRLSLLCIGISMLFAGNSIAADAKPPHSTPTTKIKVVTVDSEGILGIGYLSRTKTLLVIFRDRHQRSYRYNDVPQAVYDQFLAAESKGQFFQSQIRKNYTYKEVKTDYHPASVLAKTSTSPKASSKSDPK